MLYYVSRVSRRPCFKHIQQELTFSTLTSVDSANRKIDALHIALVKTANFCSHILSRFPRARSLVGTSKRAGDDLAHLYCQERRIIVACHNFS